MFVYANKVLKKFSVAQEKKNNNNNSDETGS